MKEFRRFSAYLRRRLLARLFLPLTTVRADGQQRKQTAIACSPHHIPSKAVESK